MRKFLLLVFLFITVTANAEVYRWKDKDGNICFGETPPENAEFEKAIEIKENTGVNSSDALEKFKAKMQEQEVERQKRKEEMQNRWQDIELKVKNEMASEEEERKTYVSTHPNLSENIKSAILNNSLCLGMTEDEVYLTWGSPDDKNRTVSASGVHEQLVYKKRGYVYLENGILTSWQESK
jgi:hypothetical protein